MLLAGRSDPWLRSLRRLRMYSATTGWHALCAPFPPLGVHTSSTARIPVQIFGLSALALSSSARSVHSLSFSFPAPYIRLPIVRQHVYAHPYSLGASLQPIRSEQLDMEAIC